MTPEQLKASILQYAIQGKLVEQRPEEGTGEELYQHIQTEKQELFFKISISDTGKGIAPERQAEIFTRFYREPEVHDKPGVGIGLYLARTIMELQKGYKQP